ncbi:MAG: MFS transporter [Halobacteriales archaeon]|nr:MFS transporter [Halobacteriales archaeon]
MGKTLESWLELIFGKGGTVFLDKEMQVVMLAAAVGMAGVYIVSPIATEVTLVFDMPLVRAGELITVYTAPSIVLVPLMGMLSDRIGRRRVIVFGFIVFGVAGGAIGLVNEFSTVLILRVIQGVGFAALMPVSVAMIGDYYADIQEATAQGVRIVGMQSVALVAPLAASGLLIASWRAPFIIYFVAIFAALWTWRILPSDAKVVQGLGSGYMSKLYKSLIRLDIAAVSVSFAIRFMMSFAFFAYVSLLVLEKFQYGAFEAGVIVTSYGILTLIGAAQSGRLMARFDPLALLGISLLTTGVGLAIIGASSSFVVLMLALVIFSAGASVSAPIQKSLMVQFSPPELRGGTISAAMAAQSFGQAAGPFLMGFLLYRGTVSITFVRIGLVLGGIGLILAVIIHFARSRRTSLFI